MRRRGEETFSQFARIDSGFLAWEFWLKDKQDRKHLLPLLVRKLKVKDW